ncbi:MAG: patatin-like phospholipase family protein, partial [Chromatiales bacterium]
SGTSIGALVGAVLAARRLDEVEAWVRSMSWRDVMGFLDVRLSGGLIRGERLIDHLRQIIGDPSIDDCAMPFGAVATSLETGNEIWLRTGSLVDAIRASIALPGLFTPVQYQGRWLIDGALVNPIPVSLCRAMGADIVIAVDLNTDLLDRYHFDPPDIAIDREPKTEAEEGGWPGRLGEIMNRVLSTARGGDEERVPGVLEVLARSNMIMSVRISRSRMAGDPPDILFAPRLSRIGLMDFHRGKEAIAEGAREVRSKAHQLDYFGL